MVPKRKQDVTMAVEVIKKLQPHRTMHLRGFDGRGAAAALHGASDSGFTVSGYFVAPSDFCVLMLWDRDNKYEHYNFKYLSDDDFTSMVLEFDLEVANLQPIDAPRFEWIPWRSLSYIKSDGTSGTIPLWDHATKQGGTFGVASRTFTPNGTLAAFDRVTLWYGNLAFDKIVSDPPETASQVVDEIRDQISDTNWPAVGMPYALIASSSDVDLTIKAARYGKVDTSGTTVIWRSGDKFTGMAAGATVRINGVNYAVSSVIARPRSRSRAAPAPGFLVLVHRLRLAAPGRDLLLARFPEALQDRRRQSHDRIPLPVHARSLRGNGPI